MYPCRNKSFTQYGSSQLGQLNLLPLAEWEKVPAKDQRLEHCALVEFWFFGSLLLCLQNSFGKQIHCKRWLL